MGARRGVGGRPKCPTPTAPAHGSHKIFPWQWDRRLAIPSCFTINGAASLFETSRSSMEPRPPPDDSRATPRRSTEWSHDRERPNNCSFHFARQGCGAAGRPENLAPSPTKGPSHLHQLLRSPSETHRRSHNGSNDPSFLSFCRRFVGRKRGRCSFIDPAMNCQNALVMHRRRRWMVVCRNGVSGRRNESPFHLPRAPRLDGGTSAVTLEGFPSDSQNLPAKIPPSKSTVEQWKMAFPDIVGF